MRQFKRTDPQQYYAIWVKWGNYDVFFSGKSDLDFPKNNAVMYKILAERDLIPQGQLDIW